MDQARLMICTTVAKLITNQGAVEYREVKVVQDNDGHNYVIPAELYAKFQELDEKLHNVVDDEAADAAEDEFAVLFDTYRTSGDLNLQLYAKVDYEKDENF